MTVIQIKNVSRWYGNVVAVNDVTMEIGPGVTGLLGPNGAGKSTILHMIAGFLAPSRGTLTVHPVLGDPVPTWRNPDIYRSLGLVPERDSVYAFLTGEEFVLATARLHELADPAGAARRAIAIVDMAEAQDRKISTYSKGMRQKVLLAASLLHNPQLVLLDEPFSGLDVGSALVLRGLIEELAASGKVILFSSHELETVERTNSSPVRKA